MFNAIMSLPSKYVDEFPNDTLQKVGKSFLYSFTFKFLCIAKTPSSNISTPLFAGSVAALASLIYAFITPIFNFMFGDNHIRFHRELIKQFVVTSLTSVSVQCLTTTKVNLNAVVIIPVISVNVFKCLLYLFPKSYEYFGEQAISDYITDLYGKLGLKMANGESSIFIGLDKPLFSL